MKIYLGEEGEEAREASRQVEAEGVEVLPCCLGVEVGVVDL